jgi:hypothetical protein
VIASVSTATEYLSVSVSVSTHLDGDGVTDQNHDLCDNGKAPIVGATSIRSWFELSVMRACDDSKGNFTSFARFISLPSLPTDLYSFLENRIPSVRERFDSAKRDSTMATAPLPSLPGLFPKFP